MALSCFGGNQVAEDITSDMFPALLRNIDGIEVTQIQGWLITVARNRARDYWRLQATEDKYLSGFGGTETSAAPDNKN